MVYKPVPTEDEFFNSRVIKDIEEFKKISDVIIANLKNDDLADVDGKIYTRDLFRNDLWDFSLQAGQDLLGQPLYAI